MTSKIPDVRVAPDGALDMTALQRLLSVIKTSVDALTRVPMLKGVRLEKVAIADGEVTRVPHKLGRPPTGWWTTRTRYKGAEAYESAQQTITSAGSLDLEHGLGGAPLSVQAHLVCINNEDGWVTGDILLLTHEQHFAAATSERGVVFKLSDSVISAYYGSEATVFMAKAETTGAGASLVNTNWRMVVRATRYRRLIDQQQQETSPEKYLRLLGSGFVTGETCDLWVW